MLLCFPGTFHGVPVATIMDGVTGGGKGSFPVRQTWFQCQLYRSGHTGLKQVVFTCGNMEDNNHGDLPGSV